jgi:hypothetical protein
MWVVGGGGGGRKRSELLEQLGLPSVGDEKKDEVYLSPDVGDESDFKPFVRLRIPPPATTFAPGERPIYSFVDEHAETFGRPDDLGIGYQFDSVRCLFVHLRSSSLFFVLLSSLM